MNVEKYIGLLELQLAVKSVVEDAVPDSFWVKAEIASLSRNRTGHCYMELVESREGKVVAQMRAIAWSSVYVQIAPYFRSVTGTDLSVGQTVLLLVTLQSSPLYGISLIIDDIDPDYTLGDAEKKRLETLDRLRREGLLEKQRLLRIPGLPYRLAVISSETAAGYRDFMRHLHENEYGFRFSTTLYPAAMQGQDCAGSIAAALDEAAASDQPYDATLILRGGGGKLDLSCYDEYEMCAAIARHPYPVLTAIGHDQDTHLCDMAAFEALKTPTALADWFLDIYSDAAAVLDALALRLKNARNTRLALMKGRLDVLAARLAAADPRALLEKGYVLVLGPDDHPLKKVEGSEVGQVLTLLLKDGKIKAEIKEIDNGKV